MLHNPAYQGRAYYGKTELRPRQRITRRVRQRGLPSRSSAFLERPRHDWIEIPVPATVSEATFALAREQLEKNQRFSPRRTIEPSLLQGLLVCQRCGYGLYRTSTRTCAQSTTIAAWGGMVTGASRERFGDNRPIRQDHLNAVGWQEILRSLEDPSLLQSELDCRLQAAQSTDPLMRRKEALGRDLSAPGEEHRTPADDLSGEPDHVEKLRSRAPEPRKQQQAIEAELQSLEGVAVDQTRHLRLVETITELRTRRRATANILAEAERQKVLRFLVHEILVGRDSITIRHSIPMPTLTPRLQ